MGKALNCTNLTQFELNVWLLIPAVWMRTLKGFPAREHAYTKDTLIREMIWHSFFEHCATLVRIQQPKDEHGKVFMSGVTMSVTLLHLSLYILYIRNVVDIFPAWRFAL